MYGASRRIRSQHAESAISIMFCIVCGIKTAGNKWANMRAHQEGWFTLKTGDSFCPAHVPAWVQEWRKRHVIAVRKMQP